MDEGFYAVTLSARGHPAVQAGRVVLLVRGGTILGSGDGGLVIEGVWRRAGEGWLIEADLLVRLPPGAELLSGHVVGDDGETHSFRCAFAPPMPASGTAILIGGGAFDVEIDYVGRLTGCAVGD